MSDRRCPCGTVGTPIAAIGSIRRRVDKRCPDASAVGGIKRCIVEPPIGCAEHGIANVTMPHRDIVPHSQSGITAIQMETDTGIAKICSQLPAACVMALRRMRHIGTIMLCDCRTGKGADKRAKSNQRQHKRARLGQSVHIGHQVVKL